MKWSKSCISQRKDFGRFKYTSYLRKIEVDFCEDEYLESIGFPVTIEVKGNALNVEQEPASCYFDLGPYCEPDVEEFGKFFRDFDFSQKGHKSYPGNENDYICEKFHERFGESMDKYIDQKWYVGVE